MDPIASFSGLATGLDTAALIDSMVAAERIPIRKLETKQVNLDSMRRRFLTMRTRVGDLQSKLEKLEKPEDVLASSVSSSDEGKVGVSAIGGAALGTYRLEVTQLAQAERTYSEGFADKNAAGVAGTGTLSIQVGTGAAVDITIDASDTLENVAGKINTADAGVSASVIFDGTNYRLQVSGDETGADNGVTFTETGTSLGLDDPANEVVAAQDAEFTIDGLAMSRSSNSVVGAIAGLTLDLEGVTTEAVSVTVDRDPQATIDLLQEVVDSYNSLMSGINSEFTFAGVAKTGDSLAGDSTLRGLQSMLGREASTPISGISDGPSMLADLGITTTRTGTLELDVEELTQMLDDDPQGVTRLLAGDEDAGVTGFVERMTEALELYADETDGLLSSRIDGFDEQKDDIDDQIARMELRIEKFEENLRVEFSNLEVLVAGLNAQGQQMLAMMGGLG